MISVGLLVTSFLINIGYGSSNSCFSLVDLASSVIFLVICIVIMYHSININYEIEKKQASELGQIDICTYRASPLLSLSLEILWDRFSWFQLLIASLIIRCLSDVFTVCVSINYISMYNDTGNCQLVYPVVYNPTKPDDIKTKFHIIAALITAFGYLMTDFLPYVFMIRIIEVSLIKKR